MAGQNQAGGMDQFDAFFQRADLDKDGRISGAEAVAFFQGSNLPKHVLAQIWMHADQGRTGFLGRAEFYNALKLVTVAQSKRELTPDIVKAALYGPAAAKIPAPQINLAAIPTHQLNSAAAAPVPQMGASVPTSSQNLAFRGQAVPNASINQQYFPPQQPQLTRPPQPMSVGTASRPPQGISGSERNRGGGFLSPSAPNSNISNDWLGGRTGGAPVGATTPNRGITPSAFSGASTPQNLVTTSSQPAVKDSKPPIASGNGFASDPFFGGDVFSAKPSSMVKQDSPTPSYSASSVPVSSSIVPVSSGAQPPVKHASLDSLSAFTMQPSSGQPQRTQSLGSPNQQVFSQSSSSLASSNISVGIENSAPSQSQPAWPKMTLSDIQKYTKVFVEVDTDRDGRITGEQARSLFLSWRLPREVLKQVWDLSDHDNDSMLSLREFCIALYLMERYREGHPLPPVLPNNILYDETLLRMTGEPKTSYGNATWGTPGLRPQQGMPATRPVTSTAGLRPPVQVSTSQADSLMQPYQQNSRGPVLESPLMNQMSNSEQNSQSGKFREATDTDTKVERTENVILDSKEKIELYRIKMQELVLYKSRCDNRLNEITERASADKREAESLGKKYEERYKQVAEIASKLAIEEATLRDIQGRKMELHQAIVKMEQGGSADGILQVRADRIQLDLEGLMKALNERCKKHGLDVKSSAIIELPFGWQPGIQEGAADWDEDWDKFEDEGFSLGKDLSLESQEKHFTDDHVHKSESAYTQSEDDMARSLPESPAGKTAQESASQEFSDIHSRKSAEVDSEMHRNFDEPGWGTFDNNDDMDSVWGFNPVNTKGSDLEKHRENYFFESGEMGINPIRTESPSAGNVFQKKSPFTFADSLPGTPVSKSGNSPPRFSGASGDHFFDNFSRFDSFSMQDGGFSPDQKPFARFDSISSSRDFGHSPAPATLTRFDSINSTRDFGFNPSARETFTRFDSINSTRDFGLNPPARETFTRFDSISSSRDFGHNRGFPSFDDSDPFGSSGPFKVSSDAQTSKKSSDNWSSF
ncbi:uncharacterized protein LOC131162221 isoform X2 [Malania oleifera]|uniref:uncharacterized protein LOC131162221 isoform X2 n=1 Tax=Malania oleifera TaxID=397392 RepID=UPI0025AE06CD|nr:uncharacterized protein LOC131162221 isoform X2 [Malania oleifera]